MVLHPPTFYLGTHRPSWLADTSVPMMVSRTTLAKRKWRKPLRPLGRWVLDSGGFTQLHQHGEWQLTASDYAEQVARFMTYLGAPDWVAPQDWMCEPEALNMTGLTVDDHQHLTTQNYLELAELLPTLVIPVVQGWTLDQYRNHVEDYYAQGVPLHEMPTVGLGSVCRRKMGGAEIIWRLHDEYGIRFHGFGLKSDALVSAWPILASADSMAWSYAGRMDPMPGCRHRSCQNCMRWALEWRRRTIARAEHPRLAFT